MLRSFPLLVLFGCPADPPAKEDPTGDDPASASWEGAVAGEPVPDGAPRAVWVAVAPGSAVAVGPSGNVEEAALMGVSLDASVLVWVTDLPDPCPALATWQSEVNAATFALMDGDAAGWRDALEAASDALPPAFTSVAVGLAAEDAAGLAGGAWPVTAEASGETPDGWRAGVVKAERQVARPDWAALAGGSAQLEDYFPGSVARDGAATTDGIEADGTLALALDVSFVDGGTLALDVTATRCSALEEALAVLHGAPSAL